MSYLRVINNRQSRPAQILLPDCVSCLNLGQPGFDAGWIVFRTFIFIGNETSVYQVTLFRGRIHHPVPVISPVQVFVLPAAELACDSELIHEPYEPIPVPEIFTVLLETIPVWDICHCLCKYPFLRVDETVG